MEVRVDLRKIRTEKERGRGKDDERCNANETVTSAAWYRRHARFGPLIAGHLNAGPPRIRRQPADESPQPTRRGYQSASCRLPIAPPCVRIWWQEKSSDHLTLESPSFSRAFAFLFYQRTLNSGLFGSRERQRVDASPLASARGYGRRATGGGAENKNAPPVRVARGVGKEENAAEDGRAPKGLRTSS